MKLSLAITTMNRYEMTVKSCAQVLNDPRINDIVILDDASTDGSYEKLVQYFKSYAHVRVMRQAQNRGMQQNKADAIGYAKNQWVIILDSDNVLPVSYLNALYELWERQSPLPWCIYCPEFARPNFDYRKIVSSTITLATISNYLGGRDGDIYNICLNTCNYVVNRDEYLKVYVRNMEMKATETIWFAYLWLKAGKGFFIVKGMQYDHLVHAKSGFLEDAGYNMKQGEKIRKMIMAL